MTLPLVGVVPACAQRFIHGAVTGRESRVRSGQVATATMSKPAVSQPLVSGSRARAAGVQIGLVALKRVVKAAGNPRV